ncbi:unnamed protein product [Protopolystoma xenopodis]|uniref:Laminin IV type A domain-containing protein n=1 Tax=Protopolystoma xenopodis TaxID=117903 RepID=A0A3S5B6S7_9PLAT|nr:unnamed protein product [Protopolystoma xenopodis]
MHFFHLLHFTADLQGNGVSIFWCPPINRVILYADSDGFQNEIAVRLSERDTWSTDADCRGVGGNADDSLMTSVVPSSTKPYASNGAREEEDNSSFAEGMIKAGPSRVSRKQLMQVLGNVSRVGVRLRLLQGQDSLQLTNLELEHAVATQDQRDWVGEVEQCICPTGYEGLSCEVGSW